MSEYIIAKQVAPERRTSPIDDCDENYLCALYIVGNDDYKELYGAETDSIRCAVNVLENYDLGGLIDKKALYADSGRGAAWYADEKNLFDDTFYIEGRGSYAPDEIEKIRAILTAYDLSEMRFTDAACALATIIDGGDPDDPDEESKWKHTEIYGCCQREWQGVFYRGDWWNEKMIDEIGMEYFNTGDEYLVHWNDEPEADATSVYVHSFATDEIKKEIADAIGCDDPAAVRLMQFAGYDYIPRYEIA